MRSPWDGDAAEAARRAREAAAPEVSSPSPEPQAGDCAAEDAAARAALSLLARSGLLGLVVPGTDGSRHLRVAAVCAAREELAYASGLLDVQFVMQGLGSLALWMAGSAGLRGRWLPALARGEAVAAFALTEPEAGSDAAALGTRAVRDGGGYVLDGAKCFISNAGLADVYTVFARTGEEGSGRKGITAFLVEAAAPGFSVASRQALTAPHPIGILSLRGCRVPASARLGEEGAGYALAMGVLDRFRPTVGASAAGLARRALDESLAHCRRRRQFGAPLADLQAVRFKLADMALWLDASRLLVQRAASLLDEAGAAPPAAEAPPAARRAAAMAKLYATEAAQRIVDEAVQLHGGLGVTRGSVVERLYREVRALRIYEGTSEIQRLVIARSLLKEIA
ncbi:MAG TPA: acyl-CoA dehydrogenase family protein [Candidatus Polarisedimenticolia bacterium]|nr:acyl-CoA dehydrogenase family protein [Candidatus Polarisedimenticolia bacterium]